MHRGATAQSPLFSRVLGGRQKVAINSIKKGKAGERELAAELRRLFGSECRRSQQYCGDLGDADLIGGIVDTSIEVKRVERLNLMSAIEKAVDNARRGEVAVVMHRRNLSEWIVSVRLADLIQLAENVMHTLEQEGLDENGQGGDTPGTQGA